MDNKVIPVAIIALVLGLGVGTVVGGSMGMEDEQEMMTTEQMTPSVVVASPAADLRVGLNSLLKEHVNLGLETLRAAHDGDESFDGAFAALDANSVAISEAVGSVYGEEAEGQFLELWREHIGYFADYTVGLATDDEEKQMKAVNDLRGYAARSATFFSTANPNLDEATIEKAVNHHVDHLAEAMAAYNAGNFEESYELGREGTEQMSNIANVLSTGIVTQFPDQF